MNAGMMRQLPRRRAIYSIRGAMETKKNGYV